LAFAPQEDIDSIIGELEPRHRTRIEGLLASYDGRQLPNDRGSDASPFLAANVDEFSPWLADRLLGRSRGGDRQRSSALARLGRGAAARPDFAMTVLASEALRHCATGLPPEQAAARAAPGGWARLRRFRSTGGAP
jgi:hypothetical protein